MASKDRFSDRIVQTRKRTHMSLKESHFRIHQDIRLLTHPFAYETAYEKAQLQQSP